MAIEIERLIATLEANFSKYDRALNKALGNTDQKFTAIEKRGKQMESRLSQMGVTAGRNLSAGLKTGAAALAGAFGVSRVAAYADKWNEAGNKIAAAGEALDKVMARQKALADLAIRSRSDFSSVVELYTGLTRSTQELGASRAQVMAVTETIAKGFSVSGASASTAAGAITQLNQAMAAGALRGDELNSVLEGAPIIAKLIADEFGVTVGQLKTLGEQGALTSDRVFKAILNGRAKIEAEFSRTNSTISQSFVNLDTAITRYIGIGDKATGTSAKISGAINALGKNIDVVAPLAVSLGIALAGTFAGGPVLGAIAGATSAIYLFSDALRPIAGDVATIGDYARAAFDLVTSMSSEAAAALQLAFAGVADHVTAALSAAGTDTASVFENLLVGVKALGNAVIGAFSFAARTITATWNNLGFAIAESMVKAINIAIQAIEDGANAAVSAINAITGAINTNLGTAIGQIGEVSLPQLTNAFQGAGEAAGEAFGSAFEALTHDYIGGAIDAAKGAIDDFRKRANDIGAAREKAAGTGASPVLDDGDINAPLKPVPTKAGGSSGKGDKAVKATAQTRLDADIQSVRDRTVAMLEEARIIDLSYRQQEKRRMALELEQSALADLREEARRKGETDLASIRLSPAQVAAIDAASEAYAAQADQLRLVQEAHDKAQAATDDFRDTARDVLGGFVSDMRQGVSATEALGNALDKLADKLIDMATDQLIAAALGENGKPASGWLGKLLGTASAAASTGGGAVGQSLGAEIGKGVVTAVSGEVTGSVGKAAVDLVAAAKAIRIIESGSAAGNYSAKGPILPNGDRGYGAYQALGENVGPWTAKWYGQRLTPSEYLSNSDAQDAVFYGQFGAYAQRYGTTGAAQAWLGGPGSVGKLMRADGNGTTVGGYGTRFDDLYKQAQQAGASLGGVSTAASAASKDVAGLGTGIGDLSNTVSGATNQIGNAVSALGQGGGSVLKDIFAYLGPVAAGGVFAAGGAVRGPGTSTSDSIPAWLSNGEFVVNAKATKRNRALLEAINSGNGKHLAAGGFVTPSMLAPADIRQINRAGTTLPVRSVPQNVQHNVTVDLRGTTGDKELDAKIASGADRAYRAAVETSRKNASAWMLQDRLQGGGEYRL